jgi:hypothetical protein
VNPTFFGEKVAPTFFKVGPTFFQEKLVEHLFSPTAEGSGTRPAAGAAAALR